MLTVLGIALLSVGIGMLWWSEYRLPRGSIWRSLIVTWCSGYLMLGGGLLLLYSLLPIKPLWYFIGPSLLINLIGPPLMIDGGSGSALFASFTLPRLALKRKRITIPKPAPGPLPWPDRKPGSVTGTD